jgi:hypothetical protein
MAMNKRGIFFTLIAISLLSLFLASLGVVSIVKDRAAINNRVESMNTFVFGLDQDIPRKIYIAGFRIVFLHEKRLLENGVYFGDMNESFNEAFFDGTIDGVVRDNETELWTGITFADIESDLNENGDKIGVGVDLSSPRVSLVQDDPWNVKVEFEVDMLVEDYWGMALWNRTESYDVYIPVLNFEDPFYLIGTNGKIAHKIVETPYNGFDTANLTGHLENFYYLNSSGAPSFLMRLEGNFSGDENGIESLVYQPDLSTQGIPVKDKSAVDHVYFSSENPPASGVGGMPAWFKLDAGHVGIYA